MVVTASALATDNVGVTGYEVTYNGTAWSAITPSGSNFTLTGAAGTTYSSTKLRAKDAAGNASAALTVPTYTMKVPAMQPGDIITSDAYTSYADGTTITGKFTDASMGGSPWQYNTAFDPAPTVSGGALVWPATRSIVTFTGTGWNRADKEVAFTVKALPAPGGGLKVHLRSGGSSLTELNIKPDGSISTLLQGPDGDTGGPTVPAGTVKAGAKVAFGVKGDTGYYTVDGVKTSIPSLRGLVGGTFRLDGSGGPSIDDLVVTAL